MLSRFETRQRLCRISQSDRYSSKSRPALIILLRFPVVWIPSPINDRRATSETLNVIKGQGTTLGIGSSKSEVSLVCSERVRTQDYIPRALKYEATDYKPSCNRPRCNPPSVKPAACLDQHDRHRPVKPTNRRASSFHAWGLGCCTRRPLVQAAATQERSHPVLASVHT